MKVNRDPDARIVYTNLGILVKKSLPSSHLIMTECPLVVSSPISIPQEKRQFSDAAHALAKELHGVSLDDKSENQKADKSQKADKERLDRYGKMPEKTSPEQHLLGEFQFIENPDLIFEATFQDRSESSIHCVILNSLNKKWLYELVQGKNQDRDKEQDNSKTSHHKFDVPKLKVDYTGKLLALIKSTMIYNHCPFSGASRQTYGFYPRLGHIHRSNDIDDNKINCIILFLNTVAYVYALRDIVDGEMLVCFNFEFKSTSSSSQSQETKNIMIFYEMAKQDALGLIAQDHHALDEKKCHELADLILKIRQRTAGWRFIGAHLELYLIVSELKEAKDEKKETKDKHCFALTGIVEPEHGLTWSQTHLLCHYKSFDQNGLQWDCMMNHLAGDSGAVNWNLKFLTDKNSISHQVLNTIHLYCPDLKEILQDSE
jgi:hypothetical protein